MPTTDINVESHVSRLKELKANRGNFDTHWQKISELVYPSHANFTYTPEQGEDRMRKIYDSAPMHSNQLLSSGLFSLMTSSASPWFQIDPVDVSLSSTREVAIYLDTVSKIMYHEINNPAAGFSAAVHECYLEYGAFGNLTLFVEEVLKGEHLQFISLPLYECYYVENAGGRVDTLYRSYTRTVNDLMIKFGVDNLSDPVKKLISEGKMDDKVECAHIILPRTAFDVYSVKSVDMPFASLYIDCTNTFLMQEKGYQELPFMGARFTKAIHEVYGRGPGTSALPDIQMLMRVAQCTIRAAQKTVDPPILLPDSGFLRPLRTTPGGLNYYQRGRMNTKDDIGTLPTGNPGFGVDYVQLYRDSVREAFYVDQLQLHTGPQMTATEVMQRTEEKLRLLGPLLGRLQTEFLGPVIARVYGLLNRAGKLPPFPEAMQGLPLKITYTSPIARAQEQVKANGLMRALGILEPMLKYSPETADIFNTDEMGRGVFEMFSISPKYLKSTEEVDKLRKARNDAAKEKQESENFRASGQGADAMARAQATQQETGSSFGTLQ